MDDDEEGGEAHAEAEGDDGMVYADGLDDEPGEAAVLPWDVQCRVAAARALPLLVLPPG